ncbi:MAG: biotin carboxylase N-terminal domain-containing protein [Bdellovibrionota bacterium]
MKLVIANRGEIARRILKTAKARGYNVAVIATVDDKNSLVCREADTVIEVSSFLNAKEIVEKSKIFDAQLIHPGYGFLSENSEFASLVEQAGIIFVGPTSANMKAMGSKESAKKMAQKCVVPTLNALLSYELKSIEKTQWKNELDKKGILLPYLVKASGGGGGRGMRVVEKFEDLEQVLLRASEEAKSAFNDETVFVERYLKNPRHIEIQVFGDGKGGGVFWGERECSLQRRHQKVIEEAPSSIVDEKFREKMGRASLELVKETQYRGAGTLEYLVDSEQNFYFLEMNTRLQVEHPVTEMVYGIDLVDAQFELACGKWPSCFPNPNEFYLPTPKGVAIEARILAEDTQNNFLPTPGKVEYYLEPQGEGVRVDSGVTAGDSINSNFDSMISKLIVHAPSRGAAIQKMIHALENYPILGFTNNIAFLKNIISHPDFLAGKESTGWIEQNLNDLNKNLIPEQLLNLFQSFGFREKLSLQLTNLWNATPIEQVFSSSFEKITENLYHTAITSLTEMQLFYRGQTITLVNPRRIKREAGQDALAHGEIKTPMPGKLYDVLVKEGESVGVNQVLFIVESMKMQLEVKSPRDGVVQSIYFEKGQNLIGSDIIATINKAGGK